KHALYAKYFGDGVTGQRRECRRGRTGRAGCIRARDQCDSGTSGCAEVAADRRIHRIVRAWGNFAGEKTGNGGRCSGRFARDYNPDCAGNGTASIISTDRRCSRGGQWDGKPRGCGCGGRIEPGLAEGPDFSAGAAAPSRNDFRRRIRAGTRASRESAARSRAGLSGEPSRGLSNRNPLRRHRETLRWAVCPAAGVSGDCRGGVRGPRGPQWLRQNDVVADRGTASSAVDGSGDVPWDIPGYRGEWRFRAETSRDGLRGTRDDGLRRADRGGESAFVRATGRGSCTARKG